MPEALLTLARGEQPEIDLEIKRSHFLGRAARTSAEAEARAFIASVRAKYPDARHHCSAFVVNGADGARPIERSSDDGEPSGTAGTPMLEVLRGSGLSEVTVVVTRYFGGTLLGTGGLARAYSQATAQALSAASRVQLETRHLWEVVVPVAQAGRLEADLRAHSAMPQLAGLTVEETLWGPTEALVTVTTAEPEPAELHALLAELSQGQLSARATGSRVVEAPV
ncbi:IMPACT family member yigZ [Actinomyces bovis]|uniref:IMPACT family member yigZ n=1 Tax=Actinomyces bovis TaxID=1658 RepID=A0ABY1VKR6_9ACTO|nr:YigZ family protein [Actinomyces bovis]SPT52695.1 IMPACT family member yigZ [Actinomyces bovis]VEG54634.1 IMPACT family member yigZ [Actinomyces israelii]